MAVVDKLVEEDKLTLDILRAGSGCVWEWRQVVEWGRGSERGGEGGRGWRRRNGAGSASAATFQGFLRCGMGNKLGI